MNSDQTENSHRDNERIFRIPADFDVLSLADTLAKWLNTQRSKETEIIQTSDGIVIQVKEARGRVSRLISRKAESMHVLLLPGHESLKVVIGYSKFKTNAPTKSQSKQSKGLFRVASAVLDTTGNLMESAMDGVSEMWVEKETASAIFGIIVQIICASFGNIPKIDVTLSRYAETQTDVQTAWLAGFMEPNEILLAWLNTSTSVPPPEARCNWIYLLTTHRACLTSFSKYGVELGQELPKLPMVVTDTIGKDKVTVGNVVFKTTMNNDTLFQEISAVHNTKDSLPRLFEAARLNFLHRNNSDKHQTYAEQVLDYLSLIHPNPLFRFCRKFIELKSVSKERALVWDDIAAQKDFSEFADRLPRQIDPDELNRWANSWKLTDQEKFFLALHLQKASESADMAETVHTLLKESRSKLIQESKDPALHLLADITLAVNLMRQGRGDEAIQILEQRLSELPDESLADLLPAKDMDLTKGEGGQFVRIKILELLAEIRGEPGKPDQRSLKELAILQPLVPDRLRKLCDIDDESLRHRAMTALGLLETGGLESSAPNESEPIGKARALRPEHIENKIRHPASRKGTMLAKIQGLIATKNIPDHNALKMYAKRVTNTSHPDLIRILMDGAMILGVKSMEAYISYGELRIGIRGYEGQPSFLLIGSDHLESDTPYFMTFSELRFIIGMELAHLRFGHERITSREVWEGAFDKAMSLIEMFPIIGNYIGKFGQFGKIAGQAFDMTKKFGDIQTYVGQAFKLTGKSKSPEVISDDEQQLISAFREMQLTADRAALLICGDLKSAVRAIFKSTPKLCTELGMAETYGLDTFLSRKNEKGELMFQNLAIRLAALFSFYLSEDYQGLRAEGWV